MRRVRSATLAGTRYRFDFDAVDGYCEIPDGVVRETGIIYVPDTLTPARFHEVTIHECLHALWPHARENTIERNARDLHRVLWRMGYRLK
jgi:hypothetical protein